MRGFWITGSVLHAVRGYRHGIYTWLSQMFGVAAKPVNSKPLGYANGLTQKMITLLLASSLYGFSQNGRCIIRFFLADSGFEHRYQAPHLSLAQADIKTHDEMALELGIDADHAGQG